METVLTALALSLSRLPDRILVSFAHFIAYIAFDALRIRRTLIMKNIRIAFGSTKTEKEMLHIGRQSVVNVVLTLFETLISIRQPIADRIEVNRVDVEVGRIIAGSLLRLNVSKNPGTLHQPPCQTPLDRRR